MLYDCTKLPKPLLVATSSRLRFVRKYVRLNRASVSSSPHAACGACVAKLPQAATLVAPHTISDVGSGRVLMYAHIGGTAVYEAAYRIPEPLTHAEVAFGLTCFTHSVALHRIHVAIGRLLRRRLLPRDRDSVAAAINPMAPDAAWSLWVGNGTAVLTRGRCGKRSAMTAGSPRPSGWVSDEDHSGDDAEDVADEVPADLGVRLEIATGLNDMRLSEFT